MYTNIKEYNIYFSIQEYKYQRIQMKTAGGVQAQLLGKSQEARKKVDKNIYIYNKQIHTCSKRYILLRFLHISTHSLRFFKLWFQDSQLWPDCAPWAGKQWLFPHSPKWLPVSRGLTEIYLLFLPNLFQICSPFYQNTKDFSLMKTAFDV